MGYCCLLVNRYISRSSETRSLTISMGGRTSIFSNHVTSPSFTRNCDKIGFQTPGLVNEPDLLGNDTVHGHTKGCVHWWIHTLTNTTARASCRSVSFSTLADNSVEQYFSWQTSETVSQTVRKHDFLKRRAAQGFCVTICVHILKCKYNLKSYTSSHNVKQKNLLFNDDN